MHKTIEEKVKLRQEQKTFRTEAEIKQAQNRLQKIENVRKEIKAAKFKSSHLGKFTEKAKAGASSVIAYEKSHGKKQLKSLKRFIKKLS